MSVDGDDGGEYGMFSFAGGLALAQASSAINIITPPIPVTLYMYHTLRVRIDTAAVTISINRMRTCQWRSIFFFIEFQVPPQLLG
jgi:hypothetical protein